MSDPRSVEVDEAVHLLGLLAEPTRLKVVAAIVLGATDTAAIRAATGLSVRAVQSAVGRLETGGVLVVGESLQLDLDAVRDVIAAAAPPPDRDDHGASDPADAAVLRTFLRDGRIARLPAARGKRRVLLEHVVIAFDVGVRYPEREVDAILRAYYPDYAALRRYLVDEELMDRADGVYWRVGGPVEV